MARGGEAPEGVVSARSRAAPWFRDTVRYQSECAAYDAAHPEWDVHPTDEKIQADYVASVRASMSLEEFLAPGVFVMHVPGTSTRWQLGGCVECGGECVGHTL